MIAHVLCIEIETKKCKNGFRKDFRLQIGKYDQTGKSYYAVFAEFCPVTPIFYFIFRFPIKFSQYSRKSLFRPNQRNQRMKTKGEPNAGQVFSQITNPNPGQIICVIKMRPKAGETWFLCKLTYSSVRNRPRKWIEENTCPNAGAIFLF